MIKLTFPDGSIKEYKKGIKVVEVIESISISLKKKCLAGKLNDSLLNLFQVLIISDSKIVATLIFGVTCMAFYPLKLIFVLRKKC